MTSGFDQSILITAYKVVILLVVIGCCREKLGVSRNVTMSRVRTKITTDSMDRGTCYGIAARRGNRWWTEMGERHRVDHTTPLQGTPACHV
jgi:hypothetical protein